MSMTFATNIIINNGYTLNNARIFYWTIGTASMEAVGMMWILCKR